MKDTSLSFKSCWHNLYIKPIYLGLQFKSTKKAIKPIITIAKKTLVLELNISIIAGFQQIQTPKKHLKMFQINKKYTDWHQQRNWLTTVMYHILVVVLVHLLIYLKNFLTFFLYFLDIQFFLALSIHLGIISKFSLRFKQI